jgi:hypothetical protein
MPLSLSCFLQVDVIDAEYTSLVTQLRATNSFRSAYSLHRTFLATVARLAMVDNAVVQDAIERVIQVCDTNIYVCMCVLFIPILSLNLLFSILHVLMPGLLVVRCAVQVCLRYLAISQVLAEMEQQQIPGAALGAFPPEELDALRRDFYTQVLQL